MEDKLISELDYVGSSGYTLNDLLVLVNYDVVEGTTKNTKITDLKNYVLSSVSASTNTTITGFTYNENTFTLYDNSGSTFNATINSVTGLTINGNLSVTGTTSLDSINVNTLSASTYQNLPLDIRVTGGTFDTNTDTITLTKNDGNTVLITGLTDWYTTGFTYSNNTFSIKDNSGSTFNSTINTMTGLTVNGNLTVTGNTSLQSLTATTTNINGNFTVSGTTTLSGTTNQIGNLTLKNSNSGNTGTILFDTSLVSTGTTNTVSFQNQSGTVALLSDISTGDPNSKGYYYMENNAIATVCTSNASFYKVSGSTSTIGGYLNYFSTGTSSNRLVYTFSPATGSTVTYLKYNISASVQTAGGGLTLNLQLRKNNSPIPITLTTNTQGTNQPTAINITGIVTAQYNDFFELWVNCTTNTSNVLVTDLSVSLFT